MAPAVTVTVLTPAGLGWVAGGCRLKQGRSPPEVCLRTSLLRRPKLDAQAPNCLSQLPPAFPGNPDLVWVGQKGQAEESSCGSAEVSHTKGACGQGGQWRPGLAPVLWLPCPGPPGRASPVGRRRPPSGPPPTPRPTRGLVRSGPSERERARLQGGARGAGRRGEAGTPGGGRGLRGGARRGRGLAAAAAEAGPGAAGAAGRPGRPATAERRPRGRSLRYLPVGRDGGCWACAPGPGRGPGVRSTAPPHRRVVVEAYVWASPVPRPLHQLTLLRAVRWAWVGSQGAAAAGVGVGGGGRGARRAAGAGYSASPSAAAGRPRTGCTAASRPPRRGGWCWSASARGTAWGRPREAGAGARPAPSPGPAPRHMAPPAAAAATRLQWPHHAPCQLQPFHPWPRPHGPAAASARPSRQHLEQLPQSMMALYELFTEPKKYWVCFITQLLSRASGLPSASAGSARAQSA